MPRPTLSAHSAPPGSSVYHHPDVHTNPKHSSSMADFEVEHSPGQSTAALPSLRRRRPSEDFDNETAFRSSVAALLMIKAHPFAVSGRIPIDPSALTLFFRSKSGITHSVDFPIDIDHDMPPALDVLIAACRPHPTGVDGYTSPENESLFYPPDLPLTTTLEIANHPILETVRNMLFPTLPVGHYLTAIRDKLEIVLKGNSLPVQQRPSDNRVATIVVTLPVRFRGGTLIVRSTDGREDQFAGRGGKSGDMEWTAFMADADHEVDTVQKGCRITISYGVQLKTFGPALIQPDPLIVPSDAFLDLLSPILNRSRGRRLAFYLTGDYGVNPAESLAESLVPYLKGGDSLLYHAIKLYKLSPELRWTAGGYIWPVDKTVELLSDLSESPNGSHARMPISVINGGRLPGTFNSSTLEPDGQEDDDLHRRVQKSGAVPIAETDIVLLNDFSVTGPITKERVPFAQGRDLEKLVVNVLMVVFVP
ncbi:uncharacterized protein LAESUDRAFT_732021 [Laetiporus sulphureus 93-53]|uniref:Uncharacterized protein n=1 Tax=Laetiporus sulphureus 93-53 TaxID=1314785 RepID=A0A165BC10_9APHY|nr:uncharacterized protein LAESUDRAFT_732021 [Laetiporus sulphureus 93-53]KZT00708.1 hypothetical protein LAESUDRAFT_732021 [Laetiporus sulphureus 93-53]